MKIDRYHVFGLVVTFILVASLVPRKAHAHLVQTGFGTFCDGIVHLFITPSDILIVLGIGLLAGLCGTAASRTVVFALPATWLTGGLIGSFFPTVGTLPWLTTISLGLVGILVATAPKMPRLLIAGLACTSGLVHGLVNGATMAAEGSDRLSLLGAALAVFAVITLVAALVVSLRTYWTRIAVRVAGSWIATIGLLMLGWLVRGLG